jgi:ribosomal protein S21
MTGVIIRCNESFEKALKKFTEAAKKKEAKRLNS